MARTVTVRLSVVVALLAVAVGGGIYYDAAQDNRLDGPERSGITVEPTSESETATNLSVLPRDERALFLLAVEHGDSREFHTADTRLREAASGMPSAVRFDGTVYAVSESEPGGWAIQGALPVFEWLGLGIATIGSLALFFLLLARLE